MNLTRKNFLKTVSVLAGGLILPNRNIFASLSTEPKGFTPLRNNIGIFTERGGTIGWYINDDAVAIIDSQYPEQAQNMFTGLRSKTKRNIDILFNTHHHGDHTSGNIYLKEFTTKIVAHENSKMLQEKNNGNDPAKPQAYPTATFKNTWGEKLGDEKATAMYFGRAHTAGDSIIHFEEANIAHMGDLVFNKTYPFIDLNGGGDLRNWIKVIESAAKHFDKDTLFIFGHGADDSLLTGSRADLHYAKDFIDSLVNFVSGEIKKGTTRDDIITAEAIPNFEGLKERWAGAKKMTIEKAYDLLIKEI
jgi:glyoxylase-like metal-dependent hydrolase (beta-lactamase superfamily II)